MRYAFYSYTFIGVLVYLFAAFHSMVSGRLLCTPEIAPYISYSTSLSENSMDTDFTPLTLLITGGAGYIGSHVALFFAQQGHTIIILDNFIHQQPWPFEWATIIKGDYGNQTLLETIFTQYAIDAVIHCASFIEVGESVKNPLGYYDNNVSKTINLLTMMVHHNIKHLLFSSSCAVYGIPKYLPLTEDHPRNPISPYGNNKYIIELLLEDVSRVHNLSFIAFRYFNAAGTRADCGLAEWHKPESHLIPLLLRAAQSGSSFSLFGDHHQTVDGSCIRDYIHVWDVARAHGLALEYLKAGGNSDFINLGSNSGISVKQMIQTVEETTGNSINTIIQPPRPGDPDHLIADAAKAHSILGWYPEWSSLHEIVRSAYEGQLLINNSINL